MVLVITTWLSPRRATGRNCIRKVFMKCWTQWKPPLIKTNMSGDNYKTWQQTVTGRDCKRLIPIYMWIQNNGCDLRSWNHPWHWNICWGMQSNVKTQRTRITCILQRTTMISLVMRLCGLTVFPDDGGSKNIHQDLLYHMPEEHVMNVQHHGNFKFSRT
jgi:hypothetical protein